MLERTKINEKEAGILPLKNLFVNAFNVNSSFVSGGSGCGSVCRVVASDTRGPRFESSHRQTFIGHLFVCCQLYWKDENKEKEARNGPFLNSSFCPCIKLGGNWNVLTGTWFDNCLNFDDFGTATLNGSANDLLNIIISWSF